MIPPRSRAPQRGKVRWRRVELAPLLPQAGATFVLPGIRDAALLLTLAMACTLLPFALALVALRRLSAFYVQLATNLEPVYAIVLAIVLLGEQHQLDGWFYAGVIVILAAVFAQPLIVRRAQATPSPEMLGAADSAGD